MVETQGNLLMGGETVLRTWCIILLVVFGVFVTPIVVVIFKALIQVLIKRR